jgi:hypothetical protein
MKLCQLSAGRWSALLIKREEGQDVPPGNNTIDVKVYQQAQHFTSYSVSLALKDGKKRLDYGLVRHFTDRSRLSKNDAKSYSRLVPATEELCLHLLCGGSVREWCKEKGLDLLSVQSKMPTGGNRPRTVDVQAEFVSLPPQKLTAKR